MMKRSLLTATLLATGSAAMLGTSAHAATIFDAVGTYASGTNTIETSATTDTGNELSLATFTTNVEAAFLAGTGGVMTWDNETTDASAVNGVEFDGGDFKLQFQPLFDTTASNGRTPTSGSRYTSFGTGGNNSITFGTILDSSETATSFGVIQAGIVILSRDGVDTTVSMTANFSGGGSEVVSGVAINRQGGDNDTFFGFVAPTGETITSLTYNQGGAFLAADDFGFVTNVPEPGSLALLAAGGLCVLRRRRG